MTEEICRPKAKDNNGLYCGDDSDSHGCPLECDEAIGEVLCPTYETVLGCKPRAMCKSRPLDSEREFCPSHSVCIKECQPDEVLCTDGVDSRGCKNEELCISRGKDKNGVLCADLCPSKCTEGEYFCPGLIQSNGCKGIALCVEKKADTNDITCPEICPIACNEKELKVHGEIDSRGCLVEDTCKANQCYKFDTDYRGNELNNCGMETDSSQECQEACAEDDACVEFTWIGIEIDDLSTSKNKCCLKNAASSTGMFGNVHSAPGLVSGPKNCD